MWRAGRRMYDNVAVDDDVVDDDVVDDDGGDDDVDVDVGVDVDR